MIPRQTSDNPIDRISFGLMVAIGGEDSSETLALLNAQERITRRELEEVPQRAEARGEEFVEFTAPSREALIKQLEIYLAFVLKAKQALEDDDPDDTLVAYEESQEILPTLTAAMEAYSNDFASFGPYQSLPANTLVRMIEGIASGEVLSPAWAEYCQYFSKGISERATALKELALPGQTLLQNCCGAALNSLGGLSASIPPSVQSAHPLLSHLDESFIKMGPIEQCLSKSEGPTTIPATNVILGALASWSEGKLDLESLSSIVDDYADLMDDYTEAFENAASKPVESALIQEEIPRTLDAMDSHYAAVEELSDGLEELDQETCKSLIERLTKTAGQLEESREVYSAAAQHQNHIACVSCSRSNPPENRNCEACGEVLPRNEDGASSSTFSVLSGPTLEEHQQLEMTENVAKLFQSCDDVNDGIITHEQFLAELKLAALGLNEFIEELEAVAASAMDESLFKPEAWQIWKSTHLPYLEDVAVTYQAGINEAQDGLRSMENFLHEPDPVFLVEGVRLVWQGLSTIHRARLSTETYVKMLGDILGQAGDTGVIQGED